MARNNSNPWKIAVILVIVLAGMALAGAGTLYLVKRSDAFSQLPAFPLDSYLAGGNLWSDDEYKVEGRIDNVLLRSADRKTILVSVQPEGSDRRLPVLIEANERKKPVQREQEVILKVTVGNSQEIRCMDYATR